MIEIIPNWHPIVVHFTIGLLLTGSALFLVGYLLRNSSTGTRITTAARWNLGIGVAFAIVTVATGYQAYYSVAHDTPSHAAMTIHLKWAWASLVLFVIAAILAWRDRLRIAGVSIPLSVVLIAGALSLAVTGYLGAENVYRHGLGVMRLPESSGPGHNHSHGESEAHDHGTSSDSPASAADESHDDSEHGHDDGHEHGAPADSAQEDDGHGHAHSEATVGAAASSSEVGTHDHAEPNAPEAVLDAFHHALEEGNGAAALRWLADSALILEGGVTQSKAEYADHHLGSDMAFLAALETERLSRTVQRAEGTATIITRTRLKGRFKDRDIDLVSAETAVLRETDAGWKIEHLHWSN